MLNNFSTKEHLHKVIYNWSRLRWTINTHLWLSDLPSKEPTSWGIHLLRPTNHLRWDLWLFKTPCRVSSYSYLPILCNSALTASPTGAAVHKWRSPGHAGVGSKGWGRYLCSYGKVLVHAGYGISSTARWESTHNPSPMLCYEAQ